MKDVYLSTTLLLASLFFLPISFNAQPVLSYESRISGLNQPVDIVNAGDNSGRLFVVQQGGVIKVYSAALAYLGDYLTVTGINSGGEEGLLSMAFHPDYENPDPLIGGFFFVYFTNSSGDIELARYHVSADPNVADPASRVTVLIIPHPTYSNHNGGKLNFGSDGFLYFGTGDGGSGGDPFNNAQNGTSLLGKMLRISINTSPIPPYYSIPPGNPFIADPTVADEIWALGLRNPWRWSFDRNNGNMWIADVGQGAREEVDLVVVPSTGGMNFGWRCYEGSLAYNTAGCLPYNNYHPPLFEYPHNNMTGGFSITGGHVYRGPDHPALTGYYICADYVSGNQWLIRENGPGVYTTFMQAAAGLPGNIAGFGEAENGTLYAASRSAGVIYKVNLSGVLPTTLLEFSATLENNLTKLQWKTATENNLSRFVVEYSQDGINFQQVGNVAATGLAGGSIYQFVHVSNDRGTLFYRLNMIDVDLQSKYSFIVSVKSKGVGNIVSPTLITDGQLRLLINQPVGSLHLIDMKGTVLIKRNLNGQSGTITIPLEGFLPGTYLVVLYNGKQTWQQKVVIK